MYLARLFRGSGMGTVWVLKSAAQQQRLIQHHQEAQPDGPAGALVTDQSPAALSADSCWLVFLHLLHSFSPWDLHTARLCFFLALRKIIYPLYFKSHRPQTSMLSTQGREKWDHKVDSPWDKYSVSQKSAFILSGSFGQPCLVQALKPNISNTGPPGLFDLIASEVRGRRKLTAMERTKPQKWDNLRKRY